MSTTVAYKKYLKQEVEVASQGKLVVMMYDAAVRFCREAIKAIHEKNIEMAHNNIIRTQNIVYELMSTLNMDQGGEVAENLLRLYDYIIWELVDANTNKNADKVEAVLKVIIPLRTAWREIVQKESMPAQKAVAEEHRPVNFSG